MTDNQSRSVDIASSLKQSSVSMSLPQVTGSSHSSTHTTGSLQTQPLSNLSGHLQNLQSPTEGLNQGTLQRVAQQPTPPHSQNNNPGSHAGTQHGPPGSQPSQPPESHPSDSHTMSSQPGNAHSNQQTSQQPTPMPPPNSLPQNNQNLTTLTAAQHPHGMMGHQPMNILHPSSASLTAGYLMMNSLHPYSVSTSRGLVNSSNSSSLQQQQQQQPTPGMNPSQAQTQAPLGPPPSQQPTPQQPPTANQNAGLLNSVSMAGNMVRVSMPIQNMQNLQNLAAGGAGGAVHQMQPLQQMQQPPQQPQQQPQQMQNMPQHIQAVQPMQGIPQIQGLHPLQQVQSIQGIQGVQVLGPVPNIQGQQFLTQQPCLQNQIFPSQFQAQMMTPGINLQSVQNTQKSPAVPMQQQQVEVYTTVFQPIQIQQQQQPPAQQQQQGQQPQPTAQQQHPQSAIQQAQQQPQQPPSQQQQHMGGPHTAAGSSGVTTLTKTSTVMTRGLTQVTPQLAASQQTQQQQAQMIGGLTGPKQVLQQQRGGQPVVIGQIGVISNQAAGNQNLTKSPLIGQAGQVISSPTQLRFSGQPTFVMGSNANGNGQIIGGVQQVGSVNQFQAMGNLSQNISLAQPLFGSQTQSAIFSSPQVYIRAAAPQQPQAQQPQQPQQIMTGVPMGTARPKDTKTLGVTSLQGATRGIGTGLQTVQLTSGIRMPSQQTRMVRPLKPQKPVSPRAIQPKPSSGGGGGGVGNVSTSGTSNVISTSPSVTSTPTATVVPKLGTSKPSTITKVVNATTTPRINPTETKPCNSIVKNVERGASMVTKVFSDTETLDDMATTKAEVTEELESSEEKEAKVQLPVTAQDNPTQRSPYQRDYTSETILISYPTANASSCSVIRENVKKEPLSTQAPMMPSSKPMLLDSGTPYRVPEKKQAIVKPVLTHVIEGFVIQEASEPFPVQRYNNNVDGGTGKQVESDMEVDKQMMNPDRPTQDVVVGGEARLCCEFCKKLVPANKFKGQKRFCSNLCAKRYNVGCTKRVGLFRGNNIYSNRKKTVSRSKDNKDGWTRSEEGGRVSSGQIKRGDLQQAITLGVSHGSQSDEDGVMQVGGQETSSEAEETESQAASTTTEGGSNSLIQEEEESLSPARSPPELKRVDEMEVSPPGGQNTDTSPQRRKPLQNWNVQDVSHFLNSLPGCGVYSDMFSSQEIDGQALMLLKEDHLMNTMNIKLGPALKICASIKQILEEGS